MRLNIIFIVLGTKVCNVKRNVSIGHEIKVLSNLIKRHICNCHVRGSCGNLTEIQGLIIRYLHSNMSKDVFQKDIEEKFTIRRSTVTGVLQSMERNGYIIRETVPYDARLKKIVLTEKAINLHDQVMLEIEEFEKRITRNVSEEELEIFIQILNKFKRNLK